MMIAFGGSQDFDGSVLIMSANESHLSFDRKILSQMGCTRLVSYSSSDRGIAFLEREFPSLLVVGSKLKDMSGFDFVRAVRKQFPDKLLPSMMVTARNMKSDVLEAISAGCAGYVLRPYSIDTLTKHIKVAMTSATVDELDKEQLENAQQLVSAGNFDDAIEEFEELLVEDESDKFFKMGTEALLKGRYGKAIIAFNKALALNAMYAEAYKGMADAYRGKGDMSKCEDCLKNAAKIFATQERHQEVKDLFAQILQLDPDAVNPYNSMGMQLRKDGNYKAALEMYFQAQELSPDDENLCFNIANAYLYLDDPDNACTYLDEALKVNPDFERAQKLKDKILRKKTKEK